MVLNGVDEVIPVIGMNKVQRMCKLVMLRVVLWLTTIRYIMVTRMISTKRTGWPEVYEPAPWLPTVRGVVDDTIVA
jgi:hypothetical protein